MSQTPNQSPVPQGKENRVLQVLRLGVKLLLNNWPSKLLALVLAVALWAGLITQDPTLTREKIFRDVTVSVNGSDTLKRNGLIVTSDLDALLDGISMRVEVPQKQYANAQASNYNVRIDLTRIKEAGEQDVRVLTTNSSTYGTVTEVSEETVRVMVEEYVAEGFIPVNIVTVGEAPEGFYATAPTSDPARITVSGPRSLVERVDCAEVVVDLSTLPAREGSVEKAVSFTLLDEQRQAIESDMLVVTSESVIRTRINVSMKVYAKRDVNLLAESLYRGKPAEGYEVADVFVSPEYITVAANKDVLEALSLISSRKAVDISGKSETVTGLIDLNVPSNVAWISAEQASVTVVVRPISEARAIEGVPVTIENVPGGMTAAAVQHSATVTITGPQTWVKTLTKADLTLSCDASGLAPGVYMLPLQCSIVGSEGQEFTLDIEPMTVRVIIAAQE